MENAAEAGRHGIRVRDAALSPLPRAGLRLRLPDDGARSGRPTVRCRTTTTSASAAATACWRVPWDVPTADWNSLAPKISKCTHCADRVAQPVPIAFNGQALQRRREQAVHRQHRDSRPASRRAPPTPSSMARAMRCWRKRTSASLIGPTGTSITSTGRRSWAARACCTSRGCRSRNSASRPTARSRSRRSARRRSAPCRPR